LKAIPYLGDECIRHRIVYDANRYCECIYCGKPADSREHIPSKVFLEKPYPDNLFLVPACKKCNNSFSADELYTWFIIQTLKKLYYENKYIESKMVKRRFKNHPVIIAKVNEDLREFLKEIIDRTKGNDIYNYKSKRIERILEKLAVGHSVFELSEGYYIEDEEWSVSNIAYAFAPSLSQNEIDDFEQAIDISNQLLPEIGSRVYDHIYVVQAMTSNENIGFQFVMLDWVDIQEEKYRYICANSVNEIVVKIVIDEFLYTSITFSKELHK
jgi:hypothetical protein